MNGFMLFAKKFRLELIQQHPGKDNRSAHADNADADDAADYEDGVTFKI